VTIPAPTLLACHITPGNVRVCEDGTAGCVVCHEALIDEADMLRAELGQVREQLEHVLASGDCHGPLTVARYAAEADLQKAREDRDLMAARIRELREQLHPALTKRDALLAEVERLRALVVEACDLADTAARFLSPLYRSEFYRRDGARIAAIKQEVGS
jgi:hypothetical protein